MKKILIIDDDPDIRLTYTELLEQEGYETRAVATAQEGYAIVKIWPVDLILLDIRMPKVSGQELYDVLHLFFRDSRVLVTSVYPVEEQQRMIHDASGYYDKAQGLEGLLEKVRSILEEEHATEKEG